MPLIASDALAARLSGLQPEPFAALCNDLLSAAARSGGVPATCLNLTLRVHDRDGGIDARCTAAPRAVPRLIPGAEVVYQYKSGGASKSVAALVSDDIVAKPRVSDAIRAGVPFVYMAAWEKDANFEKDVRAEIRARLTLTTDPEFVFIGVSNLAQAVLDHPALLHQVVRVDGSLLAFPEWSAQPKHATPFQTDDEVRVSVEALRALVSAERAVVRIAGAAGSGKTRTVMEALRGSPFESDTLYAGNPDEVPSSLLGHLRDTQTATCCLVVDEVTDEQADRLRERVGSMRAPVRLVMIGLGSSASATAAGAIQIKDLSEEVLAQIVQSLVPGIPAETAKSVAQNCEGSPKLAVVIAACIRDKPDLAGVQGALAVDSVRSALDRYLDFRANDPRWRALSILALLDHVGWSRDLQDESTRLYTALGRDPVESRQLVKQADDALGVAPETGRVRYVSPSVLADYLAAQEMNSWDAPTLARVMASLTPPMQDRLLRRVRRCAVLLQNRGLFEGGLLGEAGPFRTLPEADGRGIMVLLHRLAGPFPSGVLRVLQRLIEGATDAEIAAAKESRRDMVHALADLQWDARRFEVASALLLRLAVNENETWANNAAGTWEETFQTRLGRTAAPPPVRQRVLRTAAESGDPRSRLLAAKALSKVVHVGHVSRMGGPPEDVPGTPEAWRPATWPDLFDAIRGGLSLLRPLLGDADPAVVEEAVKAMAEAASAAVEYPQVAKNWVEAVAPLIGMDHRHRSRVLKALRWRLAHAPKIEKTPDTTDAEVAEALGEYADARRILEECATRLEGSDFSSHFRTVLTPDLFSEMREGEDHTKAEERIAERIDRLAAEVCASPALIDGELPWLLEGGAPSAMLFFRSLGEQDRSRTFASRLRALGAQHRVANGWASIYEVGHARVAAAGHLERVLGEWVADPTVPRLMVFDLATRAGWSAEREALLCHLFEAREVPGHLLASLTWSDWPKAAGLGGVRRLVEAAHHDPEAASAILVFLGRYVHKSPEAAVAMADLIFGLLSEPAAPGVDSTYDYEWKELAEQVLPLDPVRVLGLILEAVANREHHLTDVVTDVAREAWSRADKARAFREIIAPWLEGDYVRGWYVREVIETLPLEEVGLDVLEAWIREKPEDRTEAMAAVAGEIGERPSSLQSMLLEKFDADHGVGSQFYSDYVRGGWSGPESVYLEKKLSRMAAWLTDARPHIKRWAEKVVESERKRIERARQEEAEERVTRGW